MASRVCAKVGRAGGPPLGIWAEGPVGGLNGFVVVAAAGGVGRGPDDPARGPVGMVLLFEFAAGVVGEDDEMLAWR